MFLQSFFEYGLEFPGFTLPKQHYTETEMQAGLRNIVELTDEQFAICQKDATFSDLLARKKYRVLETLPAQYRTPIEVIKERDLALKTKDQTITDKDAEIARLKADLKKATEKKTEEKK